MCVYDVARASIRDILGTHVHMTGVLGAAPLARLAEEVLLDTAWTAPGQQRQPQQPLEGDGAEVVFTAEEPFMVQVS